MALGCRPIGAGQQPEAVAEPIGDLLGSERRDTGRSQLDRQRDPVQLAANFRDRCGVAIAHGEARRHRVGPLDEQPNRIARERTRRTRGFAPLRDRQGRYRPHLLTGRPQRFAAGGQDAEVVARPQEVVGQLRAGANQVLAIVDQEEDAPRAKERRQGIEQQTGKRVRRYRRRTRRWAPRDGARRWSGVRPGGCRRERRAGGGRRLEAQVSSCRRRPDRSTSPGMSRPGRAVRTGPPPRRRAQRARYGAEGGRRRGGGRAIRPSAASILRGWSLCALIIADLTRAVTALVTKWLTPVGSHGGRSEHATDGTRQTGTMALASARVVAAPRDRRVGPLGPPIATGGRQRR